MSGDGFLSKLIGKLRHASFYEICTRSKEVFRTLYERLVVRLPLGKLRVKNCSGLALRCAEALVTYSENWEHIDTVRKHSIPQRADELESDRVPVARCPVEYLRKCQLALFTGNLGHLAKVFYADLFASSQRPSVDVKFVWEASRHQFLVDLSKASCVTGDWRHVKRAREILLDWIDANPPLIGVNWTSALELAIRSISGYSHSG